VLALWSAPGLHASQEDKFDAGDGAMSKKKYWVHDVKTISTSPPGGTFRKDAETIARVMASKKVSPKGIGSGIKMVQYYINRAGKGLSPRRRQELEKAKRILQERLQREKKHASSKRRAK
jgi:Protein of unknown function (DUF3175)